MTKLLQASAALLLLGTGAMAEVIKLGVVAPFSGPDALQGRNLQAGIEAWFALNGHKVGDHEIRVVYRDLPAPDPARAVELAQELVLGERVHYLAGYHDSPDAALLEEAHVPMVLFGAGAPALMGASPYIVRTSFTLPQVSAPMASVARARGIARVLTVTGGDGPGLEAERAFAAAFEAEGGAIVEPLRMAPGTEDFGPIMRQIRDSGAQAVFVSLPSGPQMLGFTAAYAESGLRAAGVALLAPGVSVPEPDLPALGPNAEGMLSTFHYAVSHDSPENAAFVAAAAGWLGALEELSFPAVGAYDGMRLIAHMIAATGGRQDAETAVRSVKGLAWVSPRGPVSLDPGSRHITQTVYLREVAEVNGRWIHREIDGFEAQGDPGR